MRRSGPALVLLGLSAAAIFGGRIGMLLVVIVVAAAAGGELYRLLRSDEVVPGATTGHAALVALFVTAYVRGGRAPAIFPFIIAAALFLAFVLMLLRRDRTNATRAVASTVLPVIVLGLPAAYAVALRSEPNGYTPAWVFVLMVVGAEIGGSVLTSFARRRALIPRARRTWERLAGAAAGALIAALVAIAGASPPFTWARALLLAITVATVLVTGDLAWATIQADLGRVEPGATRGRAIVAPMVFGAFLAAPAFFYVFRALVS
ncbi:MAG TPA: phosphatidate cytidylyltransferase [Actinomycetota bacterium]|nr:phosphatidate cytidylyltransferase [Actinomycetota bacterium]